VDKSALPDSTAAQYREKLASLGAVRATEKNLATRSSKTCVRPPIKLQLNRSSLSVGGLHFAAFRANPE